MESRDSWLPKTVNELRVDTNPKMTFGLDGHQGPANAHIKEAANTNTQGRVEKNKPDTYYTVGDEALVYYNRFRESTNCKRKRNPYNM